MASMSKKSKKTKKPKPPPPSILKASDISSYILQKYEVKDSDFWKWLFKDCPIGNNNFLSLNADKCSVPFENMQYYFIIKDEFINDADEEDCLEIENDLSVYDI